MLQGKLWTSITLGSLSQLSQLPIPVIILIFAAALATLMKGADLLIEGSANIARRFGISELVIGLTVIAVGTSLPELVVSVKAAMSEGGELALANVVGSNTTNILLVLGLTAAIKPIRAPLEILKPDLRITFSLAITFLGMVAVGADIYILSGFSNTQSMLQRWSGGVLLIFFFIFVIRLVLSKDKNVEEEPSEGQTPLGKAIIATIVGTSLIILGGEFTVQSAIGIAQKAGIPQSTIGLTIVAFGTSLPELVASITAARKNLSDMAIGNVIGSNIMNLTMVLGTAGLIGPIHLGAFETLDVAFMTLVTFILGGLLRRSADFHINRPIGLGFFITYLSYMTFVALRN